MGVNSEKEQILSFQSRPDYGGVKSFKEAKSNSEKFFPFINFKTFLVRSHKFSSYLDTRTGYNFRAQDKRGVLRIIQKYFLLIFQRKHML